METSFDGIDEMDSAQLSSLVRDLERELKSVIRERDDAIHEFGRLKSAAEHFADQTTDSFRDLYAIEGRENIEEWSRRMGMCLQMEGDHSLFYRTLRAGERFAQEVVAANPRDIRSSRFLDLVSKYQLGE